MKESREDELKELIEDTRTLKKEVNFYNTALKENKEKLRIFMIDSGIKRYEGIELRRSFLFDIGILKIDYPKLYKEFVSQETETITKTKNIVDKKGLEKYYPKQYRKCLVEDTGRIYGL